ncbi:hypothetical protein SBD_0804 [Streptomyces bottropensis ATCC 25435]|uniref:Uncharacterized protein n=1 Tax=Streptomyces bottropensis ATCC 25435 TaxID=1054862 RepID=M3DMH0_9ACTN|nr:hypothetical protein SBD_0804 [Streptomyces bottropensis ATCC 25435]
MLHHPTDRRNNALRSHLHKNFRHDPSSTGEPFVVTPYVARVPHRKTDLERSSRKSSRHPWHLTAESPATRVMGHTSCVPLPVRRHPESTPTGLAHSGMTRSPRDGARPVRKRSCSAT